MKILVTFALETEFAPWRRLREFRPTSWGTGRVDVAKIAGAEVGVLLTGIGARHAGRRSSEVIRRECSSIDCCISSGFTGALQPGYKLNEVVASQSISTDTVHADLHSNVIECDPFLVSLAGECGAKVASRTHTTERVISTATEKRILGAAADAVEMESFEVVREASAFGIRSVAIRAISDTAKENLPLDMNKIVSKDGRVSFVKILTQLAWQPHALPRLIRLGDQSKRAAEALAKFLDAYIQALVQVGIPAGANGKIAAYMGPLR